MTIKLASKDWPRCFYDRSLWCGDPRTRAFVDYDQQTDETREIVRRRWHVADMCNCPSCPLRVAIAAAAKNSPSGGLC